MPGLGLLSVSGAGLQCCPAGRLSVGSLSSDSVHTLVAPCPSPVLSWPSRDRTQTLVHGPECQPEPLLFSSVGIYHALLKCASSVELCEFFWETGARKPNDGVSVPVGVRGAELAHGDRVLAGPQGPQGLA